MLSSSVLIAFVAGCTDYFNLEDRRHWAATLARCVAENSNTLQPLVERWGGQRGTDDSGSADGELENDGIDLPTTVKGTGAWALADGGNDGIWREALLELRTAYPAGLQNYGMRSEESGLYQRVAEMRAHLRKVSAENEKRVADNFTHRHPNIVTLPLPECSILASTGGLFDPLSTTISTNLCEMRDGEHNLREPLNIYSQTLALQVNENVPSGIAGRRQLSELPATSHLKNGEKRLDSAVVESTIPPVSPTGGTKTKKGFFSNIAGQPNDFNVDDMSLSHTSQGGQEPNS